MNNKDDNKIDNGNQKTNDHNGFFASPVTPVMENVGNINVSTELKTGDIHKKTGKSKDGKKSGKKLRP